MDPQRDTGACLAIEGTWRPGRRFSNKHFLKAICRRQRGSHGYSFHRSSFGGNKLR